MGQMILCARVREMKVGFVGAGKVGFSLGKYFKEKGLNVAGFYSRSKESVKEVTKFVEVNGFDSIEEIVQESDVLFLTVSDKAVVEVWDIIKRLPIDNKIICHCSGVLSSKIFTNIEQLNACGYSLHPMLAISDKMNSYKNLGTACFTLEGSHEYLNKMKSIVEQLDNKVYIISCDDKELYHGAAVFASNFVVALAQTSVDLLEKCGFSDTSILYPLMLANVENIIRQGTASALTGPVERCDIETVASHIACLSDDDKKLYALLSKKLIKISEAKNPDVNYEDLKFMIGEII